MIVERKSSMFISIVIVLNYGEKFEKKIFENLIVTLTNHIEEFELVIIDNTSSIELYESLEKLTKHDGLPNLQVYRMANIVDKLVARWAGIENSIGDYVISIDKENLDEGLIKEIIKNINNLNEIILFKNRNPKNKSEKGLIYSFLSRLTNLLTKIDLNKYSSESITISRRVVNYLSNFENPEIYLRNIHTVTGFRKNYIYMQDRTAIKNNIRNSILRGLYIVTSLSYAPIRLANIIASAAAIGSFTYSIYIVLVWILNENVVPGWVSLSIQISTLFFLNSLVLLLISEYILRLGKRNNRFSKYYFIDEITSINITRKKKLNIDSCYEK